MSLESVFKTKICDKLRLSGWLIVHYIQTNNNGWPDTGCYRDADHILLEFKRPDKKPGAEELQKYRHGLIRAQGFIVIVVDSPSDISFML